MLGGHCPQAAVGTDRYVPRVDFTALHRALGYPPGVLTDEMLTEAVRQEVAERDGLDWKSELPSEKDLAQSDTVKDIAAMANSGGGVIVFGVQEEQKRATRRTDIGEVSESYERTLRRVAVSGIQPPVFGLGVVRLGGKPNRALAVVVPASADAPHLIYRGDYFGAPIRNHADTEWMRERHLESLYRARLDERTRSQLALADLYSEFADGRDSQSRAWLVAVARPRVPLLGRRMSREQARDIIAKASELALVFAGRGGIHPLESVDRFNPRIGLRRWIAPNTATADGTQWKESWVSVYDDGTVSVASAAGAHRAGSQAFLPGNRIRSSHLECCVADLMSLARHASAALGTGDYEARIGIEWTGNAPLIIETIDNQGLAYDSTSTPIPRYTPVTTSFRNDVNSAAYLDQVLELATDVVNQGGVQHLQVMTRPDTPVAG
jgi:hypothetical protein